MHDRSPEFSERTGNLLLDALSRDERDALLTDARTGPIHVGTTLFRPGDAIDYVAFPTSGTTSMLAQPDRSTPVEAATIGREGPAPCTPRWAHAGRPKNSSGRSRAR
jgi:hypothetical protein